MSKIGLMRVCNITTGRLDSNALEEGGIYPFFTCAPEPLAINTYAFDEDAILLAGNNASGNFHCQRYNGKFNAYQRTYVITSKDGYDIDYLYYSLKISLMHLGRISQGSQTKFLTIKILESFMIEDIPLEDQIRRSRILVDIDKKISTNNKISSELKAMAATLYNYWFVQFDYPNQNGRPYRASGGEMVWNEQLRRKIPKDWMVRTLNDVLLIDNMSIDPRKMGSIIMEHYSIPAFDADQNPIYQPANTIESGKYVVHPDCILTSKLNPHFKRLWDPYCESENAICSTEFIVYRPRKQWLRPYCYALLDSEEFYIHMVRKAISSTGSRKRIQPDISASFSFAIANDDAIIRKFNNIYFPIMERQKVLRKENRELKKLREWLLPVLMNGRIKI